MAIKTYYLLKRYIDTSEKNLPLYFEDLTGSGSCTVTLIAAYSDATNIECSTDNSTWTAMTASGTNYTATVPANGKLYIRANATYWSTSSGVTQSKIYATREYNVGGNIMSLLYGSSFTGTEMVFPDQTKTHIFAGFFKESIGADGYLRSAEKLALPATTLADQCYYSMFSVCTALTTAPALPATTLANQCYYSMFSSCTSLTTAPALPATTLANQCYYSMFYHCTSLTAAPALPATTLAQNCYNNMFAGCPYLNSITVGATSWNASAAYNWVDGVSATGTFTKPSGTNIPTGTSGIPSGWTVVNV